MVVFFLLHQISVNPGDVSYQFFLKRNSVRSCSIIQLKVRIIFSSSERPPEGVREYDDCNFFTENFVSASCYVEKDAHDMVKAMITPSDIVLELGSR